MTMANSSRPTEKPNRVVQLPVRSRIQPNATGDRDIRRARNRLHAPPRANSGRRFAQLNPSEQHDFVDTMRQNQIQGWQGPGGSFVYLVLRSDAVDVVYGTVEGYEALGIPYMPHIAPDKRW